MDVLENANQARIIIVGCTRSHMIVVKQKSFRPEIEEVIHVPLAIAIFMSLRKSRTVFKGNG